MDFFKVSKFRKVQKQKPENVEEDTPVPQPELPNNENGNVCKSINVDNSNPDTEDDDDDFITNEVKRRLRELRRNSFMVLIPEEESVQEDEEEEEEEVEMAATEWRDVEAEGRQFWSGFDAIYDTYCERMLRNDRLIAQQLPELGFHVSSKPSPRTPRVPSTPSPRSMSKKLASPFRCLSLNKIEEPEDETEQLQQPQNDPYEDIETAYVAQICLTWEAIHCEYSQLSQKISCEPENPTEYNHTAQLFQQFQVLLQRFIENEPFEQGVRPEVYARTRSLLPKLLQVPKIQGSDKQTTDKEDPELRVLAPDLIKIIEGSILTFRSFLKMDKKKMVGSRKLSGCQNQLVTPLQQVQSSLEKKVMKLKELRKRKKSWKDKAWPGTQEDVELLLGLIDAKVVSRVLRMNKISSNHLVWCEEKMKKLDISDGKLLRDPSPILFPS